MSLIDDLVLANRILANEGVVDAYGHISVRNPDAPDTFFLSRSRSPQHVTSSDIMQFDLEGQVVDADDRAPYLERFIHSAIYEARPDVQCVIHAHTEAILPFTITNQPLMAVTHSVSDMGTEVPRWDIRTKFGDSTNLMVTDNDQGRDVAVALGEASMVLMRGHGFAYGGPSTIRTVSTAVYLARNARVLLAALNLQGPITALSQGEVDALRAAAGTDLDPDSPALRRGWDLWSEEVGEAT